MSEYSCNDCDVDLPNLEAADAHITETRTPGGTSHKVRVPSRPKDPKGVKGDGIVGAGIERMMDDLNWAVLRGEVTRDEVTSALSGWADLQDVWENYFGEGSG